MASDGALLADTIDLLVRLGLPVTTCGEQGGVLSSVHGQRISWRQQLTSDKAHGSYFVLEWIHPTLMLM